MLNLSDLGRRSMNDLDLWYSNGSCTHLVEWLYEFLYHRLQKFLKNPLCYLFPIWKQRDQFWPCHKIGQEQPRVIILINFVVYQLSRSSAVWFQRRRFFKIFNIYGHGGHIDYVTWTIWTNFHSTIPWRLHMKFGCNRSSGLKGKEVWEMWIWVTLDHISSCTHLLTASTSSDIIDYNSFWKIHVFTFFSIQQHKGPNLTLP